MYGNGGMMMGGMGLWGMLSMLLFWIVFILLIVWIVRTVVGANGGSNAGKAILDKRYARGELTRKEYEQMKKDIGG